MKRNNTQKTNKMKNQILFCENRNKFFKEEKNGMTIWTSKNSEAEKFNLKDAELKIDFLKKSILDSKYIIAVKKDFDLYN